MDRGEKMAHHSPKWTVIAHAARGGVGRPWLITGKQTEAPVHAHRRHAVRVCVCVFVCAWGSTLHRVCVRGTFLSTQATERPAIRLATSLCSLISSLSRSSKRPLRNLKSLSEYVARPWCGETQSSEKVQIVCVCEWVRYYATLWVSGNRRTGCRGSTWEMCCRSI